eukprot:COSAG05_NODE_2184_length_3428_cov_9.880445_1_plen_248_part_00
MSESPIRSTFPGTRAVAVSVESNQYPSSSNFEPVDPTSSLYDLTGPALSGWARANRFYHSTRQDLHWWDALEQPDGLFFKSILTGEFHSRFPQAPTWSQLLPQVFMTIDPGLGEALRQHSDRLRPALQSVTTATLTQVTVDLSHPDLVLPTCNEQTCTTCLTGFFSYHTDADPTCHNCRQALQSVQEPPRDCTSSAATALPRQYAAPRGGWQPSPGGIDPARRPERRARAGQPRARAAGSLCAISCS